MLFLLADQTLSEHGLSPSLFTSFAFQLYLVFSLHSFASILNFISSSMVSALNFIFQYFLNKCIRLFFFSNLKKCHTLKTRVFW